MIFQIFIEIFDLADVNFPLYLQREKELFYLVSEWTQLQQFRDWVLWDACHNEISVIVNNRCTNWFR